jgi:hypothetical protein
MMPNDDVPTRSNRKSQTLMGSVREYFLGEQFEGGDDDGENTPPKVQEGFGGRKSQAYEKGHTKKKAHFADDEPEHNEPTVPFFGYMGEQSESESRPSVKSITTADR